MKMGFLFLVFLIASFGTSARGQCLLGGTWTPIRNIQIFDVDRGDIFNEITTNIEGMTYTQGAMNRGPYFDVVFEDSNFVIKTNDAFDHYEEYETSTDIAIIVSFQCSSIVQPQSVTFMLQIIDTNNNAPRFLPSNEFTYTIPAPVPPGFLITGCSEGITVRDIDLTTQRIDFEIEDNPYFEIIYDSSPRSKEFVAILRTKTIVRNLLQPMTLWITATDVDLTGDAPLKTTGSITFKGDTSFDLPDEPVFAKPFYIAEYKEDHQVVLSESISLQSGFHKEVQFLLEGELSGNFELVTSDNEITIQNKIPLESAVLRETQIILVIRAQREYTSGDTSTIIVRLPEGVPLEFERSTYSGTITSNTLEQLELSLKQLQEGEVVNADILGEHSQYFSARIQDSSVILTITSENGLPENVINTNNFITLEVVVSSDFSRASTIVVLEIIKDDNVTPVFSKPLYTGSYETATGLTIEPITFTQGYDGITELSLSGENAIYFETSREGAVVTINIKKDVDIPSSIFNEQQILLTLHAAKPLTVGARTVILITSSSAGSLEFEQSNYFGIIENKILRELILPLKEGYDRELVTTEVLGEYSQYFTSRIQGNSVILTVTSENGIPDGVINTNNFITLEVVVSSDFSRASTIVVLEIIKEDNVTPVFNKPLYTGSYETATGLTLEPITFTQGYDGITELSISGENSIYFETTSEGPVVTISVKKDVDIPPSILNEHIFLTLHAAKPLTVGARTAIVISTSSGGALEFEQSNFVGIIENKMLRELILPVKEGYEGGVLKTEVLGEFSQYFNSEVQGNSVILTITSENGIPDSVINTNNFITLEVVVSSDFSRASTIVVLEIIKDDNVTPVFNKPLYTGSYETATGLTLEPITFTQGYDGITELSLSGENAIYFETTREGAVVTLNIKKDVDIPSSIFNQHIFLTLHASKPLTVGARTAIIITASSGETLEFKQSNYVGIIENRILRELVLSIKEGYDGEIVSTEIFGEYSQYFKATIEGNSISLAMNEIPDNIINANNFITLEVAVSSQLSRASTIVVLEIIKEDNVTPVFSKPLYTGSYETATGLTLEPITFTQGYDGITELSLSGENSIYFETTHEGAVVSVSIKKDVDIPSSLFNEHIFLTLHASKPLTVGARTTIIIKSSSDSPDNAVSFDKLVYEGAIELGIIQHESITITNYVGINVELHGEYASLFNAVVTNGVVSIQAANGILTLPDEVRHVVLELRAANARAVLLLTVSKSDSPDNVVSFDKLVYEGAIELSIVQHESITITNYVGVNVELHGEYASLFNAVVTNGVVSIQAANGILTLPDEVKQVVLELRAANARAVLLLTVSKSDSPDNVVSFDKLVYEGAIELGIVQHESITITNYVGVNVELHGEYASLFNAVVTNGVVSIQAANGILTLPDEVRHVLLELRAANARAVLLLTVSKSDSPDNVVSFDKLVYEGAIDLGIIQHESITITNYVGVNVELYGEYASLFNAVVTNGVVSIQAANGILTLPDEVRHVVLELRAANARAVLLLTVSKSDSPDNVVSFDKLVYEGAIDLGIIQHESITITNYVGVNVELYGEYASLFNAVVTNGVVSIQAANGILTLPDEVRHVLLELRAANARAVLLLTVSKSDSPDNVVSFDKLVYEGAIELGIVQHESITITNYVGVNVELHGEYASLFNAVVTNGVVSIQAANGILTLPDEVRHVLLELRAANARAVLLLTVSKSDSPDNVVSFDKLVYEGAIDLGIIQHESITITNYVGVNVELYGEYASLFNAVVTNGVVSIQAANGILTLPDEVRHVVLELRAANARAVLLLTVSKSDSPDNVVSFDKLVYEGAIDLGIIQHESITITNYVGVNVELYGEYASLFNAVVTNGVVSIQAANGILTLPDEVRHVLLELRAANARAVLLLTVSKSDSPDNVVSFDKLVYEGAIDLGIIQHESITITNYVGVNVELHGEYASLFNAVVTNGVVSIQAANGILTLPDEVRHVLLELRAANARAVLLLTVSKSDSPDNVVSFDKLVYEGAIDLGIIQHESITITNYVGVNVELYGEYASLFNAVVTNGVVSIQAANGILTLPDEVRHVVLELRAANARAVLLLTVSKSDSPDNVVSFDKLVYEGAIDLGIIQHESITITNYVGVNVELYGEYASLFNAVVTNGVVSIQAANGILTLPDEVRQVVLELRAANARAVLLLTVSKSDSPDNVVSFDKLVYEGAIDLGIIQHESITITNYVGVNVELYGEYASLFNAVVTNGVVSIQAANGILTLPDEVRQVVLELRAANARAVLLLTVSKSDSPDNVVSFDKLVYEGAIDLGIIQHESITITNYVGVNVELHGEYASLFNAVVTNGVVSIQAANGILTLPDEVRHVVLELRAANARAVLLLTVSKSDSPDNVVSFDKLVYEGAIDLGIIQHESITITNYVGVNVELYGEYASLFNAVVTNGVVSIQAANGILTLPDEVRQVVLELRAANARAVLLLTVSKSDSPDNVVSFDKLVYEGAIDLGIIQHESITITNYVGVNVELYGEYASLFNAVVTNGVVSIQAANGILTLPDEVRQVVLELRAANARAVLLLTVSKSDSPDNVVSFDKLVYEGAIDLGIIQHESITITNYVGVNVELHGEYASLFNAVVTNGVVSIQAANGILTLPDEVRHVLLELRAANARAVLLLTVSKSDSPDNVVSFDKLVYEGAIDLGIIQHESITITNYVGVNVELYGEYASLFNAVVTNGVVSIQAANGILTLPDEVRHVVLELRAANARAVLLLTVSKSDSPDNVVSFDKLVYEGAIDLGIIQHESITITNYVGVNVELYGEYASLFNAVVTNGVVSIQAANGILTLPDEVRQVVLELRAANARAVLLLTVSKSDSPDNVVSFDKLVYEGAIDLGIIQHESITITNYVGVNVELYGEYASLFNAVVTNGVVSIQAANGILTLPDEVRHVVLELRAANARAVLLLTVSKSDSPDNVVSFDKLVYEGAIDLGIIQHESITITNYVGVNVELHGEYASLFNAVVTNGVVSIQAANGILTLPDEVRHVLLELRAANARAVLLLTVSKSDSPDNLVSFDKLVYEGAIDLGIIQHESITITNYVGVNVELYGEYASLFNAVVTNGVVTIQAANGILTLPDEVRQVVLELRAANARAVLLLTVSKSDSPDNVVSFDKLVYEGAIDLGIIQHESITITNYVGVNVELHGEYASLFNAVVTNGVVSIQAANGILTLPDEVRQVVLELRAANARAVLLLTVSKSDSPDNVVSFDKLVYEGAIDLGIIQHESITITNYVGVNVELHGEYASLFNAVVTNGVVSIQAANGILTLPDEVRHVLLELRAANARAVLLLTVSKSDSPDNLVSFDKLVYEGAIDLGIIQHESITITNYVGVNVELYGEYASLFNAVVTNGVVTIQAANGILTLPDEVRQVVLELRAANARAVLLLTVSKSDSPDNVVSFDKLVYEGAIDLGIIQHESITITNYVGVNVELHGEYASLFNAVVTNGVVSIQAANGILTLPDEVRQVVLELRAANARAVLLLTVSKSDSPDNVVSFDKLVYEGAIDLGIIQHESITITNYVGVNVELHGEYASLFNAVVTNGVVSIQAANGILTLPDEVRHVVLELRAANARAVLLLTVSKSDSPDNVVSFDKLVYEGAIDLGIIQHESITITNYVGVNVELYGEYASLFNAVVTNGVVSIQAANGILTLPDEVRHVVLELRAANARAVLLLTVSKSDSPDNVVSFDKLVYEGAIDLGIIQHESITITNYVGVNVELHGEYASLFNAVVTNGVVSIQAANGILTLPDEVRHVLLELRAANARAVLLLTVSKSDSPDNVVSFDKLVYEGAIDLGIIQHESITITNYVGVNVELYGEYASLFNAVVTNGVVSIQAANGILTLPDEVRQVVLELRAANARAVLLLTVSKSDSPDNVVSFDKLVYEGAIDLGIIQHESITITNYVGVNVELHGEYASLFNAVVTNGVVSIQAANGILTLPDEVRHVVLELRAANARAVLLLTVSKSDSPDNVVSFDKLVYEGAIDLGIIQHESITITNYVGVNVELHGEYASLFNAVVTNGVVSIQAANGILTLPDEVRQVVLELRAANARAVLLLTVSKSDSPDNIVSFDKLVYEGAIELGIVQHESITITNYVGVNVELHGEYASLFNAVVTNGVVSIQAANGILTLPDEVRQVVLELRAANARAVLLLTVSKSDSPDNVVSFDKLVYEGAIDLGIIQHESITITNYVGVNVELHGEYASLFNAVVTNGVVSIQAANGILTLPDEVRHVVLELRAANARAVLLLTVSKSDSPDNVVSFDKLVYEGAIELGIVQHESITITNYVGVNVELHGEYASLFNAVVTNGVVSIQAANGILTLPDEVRHVVLELRAANARAVLLLTVSKSDSPDNVVSFDKLVYEGTIDLGIIQHESITITNYVGVNVELHGEYASLFNAVVTKGVVSIQAANGILTLPDEVRQVVLELRAANARAVLLLTVSKSDSPDSVVSFDKLVYEGVIELGIVQHESITITNYVGVNVELHGEYSSLFNAVVTNGVVTIQAANGILTLPDEVRHVVLELRAANARAVLLLTLSKSDSPVNVISFDKLVYEGTIELGNIQHESITITNYEGVNVEIHGEYASLFNAVVTNGVVSIQAANGILTLPDEVRHVVLELRAANARAVLLLTVSKSDSPDNVVSFDKLVYEGTIDLGIIQHESITITNYVGVNVELHGEYTSLFNAVVTNGVVSIQAANGILTLPDEVRQVVLELRAANARAVLLLTVSKSDSPDSVVSFDKLVYEGAIELGIVQHESITITNYVGVNVELHGEYSSLFNAVVTNGVVTIQAANGILTLPDEVRHVVLELRAANARAVLLLTLSKSDSPVNVISFDKLVYEGTIELGNIQHESITITNYEGVNVEIHGEYASLFNAVVTNGVVSIQAANEILTLPDEVRHVVLELRAANARAVLLLTVSKSDSPDSVVSFDKLVYEGAIELGIIQHESITITNYVGVNVELNGEYASLFNAVVLNGVVSIQAANGKLTLPDEVRHVVLELRAANARAVLLLTVSKSDSPDNVVSFDKLVYEGAIELGIIQHESITITNYVGVNVELHGEYSSLFNAVVTNGVVSIQAANGILTLPDEVRHVVLELRAANARAVLLLTVSKSDVPVPTVPTVKFDSYSISVDSTQIGVIGKVQATADNGETVTYDLNVNDAHLLERISINVEGELHLSAPANTGVYAFEITATTVISRATATTTVTLTVQATKIDDDRIALSPLIILNRKEEEPHNNLVPLPSDAEGCQFTLNNRWPVNQNWLYVDGNGLHTTSIDREHESIAFMALSQVQVELILTCESDNTIRKKRALRTDWLGPYDYGANKWILTESIPYNRRRTLVNLIVDDINDNYPIFVSKENEPIAVGYPVGELEERILPRSLAELQATDADVGENAALVYWSAEEVLAVSPTTGFVHLRTGAKLQDNQILTVNATDQNGQGLTGDIKLMVKLLDVNNIAVVTVQNAFLDDEKSVLEQLSEAVGYEMKALKSVVISEEQNQNLRSRNVTDMSASGTSLLLYVYGLIDREPVAVSRLTEDITNNAAMVSVINTVALEDHLVPVETIVTEREIGFFVATIVLSILLFIIMVLTAILFFLKWRRNKNYDEFSDSNSSASAPGLVDPLPKTETPRARLNIEELKRSEQRLQDRLQAPFEAVTVEAMPPRKETPLDAIADLLSPESNTPIVIQSVDKLKDAEDDDDDEFGEKAGTRRKSVVTFNENVEKIIHVHNDNDTDSIGSNGYEVFRL